MNENLSIVLVSGGMDSCVTAAIAHHEHEMAFLHVNYGQRTEERELKAFDAIADYYKVKKRLVADIEYLKEIGGSSLTNEKMEIENSRQSTNTENGGVQREFPAMQDRRVFPHSIGTCRKG